MDLKLSQDEQTFQTEIARFVDRAFPMSARDQPSASDAARWQQALIDNGWSTVEWPIQFGGPGWTPVEIYLWYSVTLKANCPAPDHCAVHIVGPLIQRFGSPAVHSRYLENIVDQTRTWGNAAFFDGSAGVQQICIDNHYLLNGDTPCISSTEHPDLILVLATSNRAPCLFLVDTKSAGINLTITSRRHKLHRLTLDEVRLPASCLLGEIGSGLDYLVSLLTGAQSVSIIVRLKVALSNLKTIIEHNGLSRELESDLAAMEIELAALETTSLRSSLTNQGENMPIVSIRGQSLARKISDSFRDALGYYALPDDQLTPGNNEPALSAPVFSMADIDDFPGCPTGFRHDLVAKTLLGL